MLFGGPWSGAGGSGAQPQVGASLNAGAPRWGTWRHLPQCWGNREHTHTKSPRQAPLLCHLILRECICLSDPRASHLLVYWVSEYRVGVLDGEKKENGAALRDLEWVGMKKPSPGSLQGP